MKSGTRNLILLAGAGVAAYLIYRKTQGGIDDIQGQIAGLLEAPGRVVQQAAERIQSGTGNVVNQAAQSYAGAVVPPIAAVSQLQGMTPFQQAQGFSEIFNRVVGGGAQLTVAREVGAPIPTAQIALNPNLQGLKTSVSQPWLATGSPAQIVQGALATSAAKSGIGVASVAPSAGGGILVRNNAQINQANLFQTPEQIRLSQKQYYMNVQGAAAGLSMAQRLALGLV